VKRLMAMVAVLAMLLVSAAPAAAQNPFGEPGVCHGPANSVQGIEHNPGAFP
jgi:hypothetical protein